MIIQARLCSTRLPGKVMRPILGRPILVYVIERVKKAKRVAQIIVATTRKREDSKIARLASKLKTEIYRGSEDDVLDRFYQAARLFRTKHMVRITADCPLIDPEVIDKIVDSYFKSGADYCSNTLEVTFPDGQDTEVFSFQALQEAWQNAKLLSEREHVTPYIKKNPERFKLVSVKNEVDLSEKRWTLDTKEDFKFIKAVLEALYPKNSDFTMKDVLRFLEENRHLEEINRHIVRDEGYLKSLKEDRKVRQSSRS